MVGSGHTVLRKYVTVTLCMLIWPPHLCDLVHGVMVVGLATQSVAVRLQTVPLSGNNLRQVVHTVASVTKQYQYWYRSKGDDALRLGR